MLVLFRNKLLFTITFFTILLIDIIVKLFLDDMPWRYFSKPFVVISLFLFYFNNGNEQTQRNFYSVIIGLVCFFLGDILLISHEIQFTLITGILIFSLGKLMYVYRLSHQEDFNILTIIPFLLLSFAYMFLMFNTIYDNLDGFFVPVLIYIFISQLMFLMAYLRYSIIVTKGFYLVFFGVLSFIISESIMSLKLFYTDILYQDVLIMLFYGTAQFLIIFGIIESRRKKIKQY